MDIESLTDAALRKLWDHGFDELDDLQQILVTVWGLEAEVNNGGFDQYYTNSYGDQAQRCPDVLRTIGANRTAELVTMANAAFGADGPPEDIDLRQGRLEEIQDAAVAIWKPLEEEYYYQYPDDLSKLLTLHVERTRGAA